MGKALGTTALTYLWEKIKATFAKKTDVPTASTTTPNMDGTAAVGSSAAYARADHRHPSDDSKIGYDDTLLINNTFAKKNKFYSNKTENALYAADKRWIVTHKLFDSEGNFIKNLRTDLFNGDYDQGYNKDVLEGTYAELYIGVTDEESIESATTWFMTYCSGELIASFYYKSIPSYMTAKVYWARTNPGWHDCSPEPYDDITGSISGAIYKIPVSGNYFGAIKITYGGITQSDGYGSGLCQVEWKQVRVPVKLQSAVTKYPVPQDLYGEVTAPKFIKRGGTSSQFLKADGSVDSNSYATTSSVPTKVSQLTNDTGFIVGDDVVFSGDDDGQGVIAEGGDVNVIETVKVNGTALTPDANKAVNVVVPTSLSGLASDTTHRTVSDTEKSTWNGKQDALVSGTNIKTINNESILGSGNITIQGGSGGSGDENVIEIVKVNGTALTPDANKAVDVTVPTESTVSGWGFTKNSGTVSSLSDLGITATATELNYTDGVTSNIQTQLNAKGTYSKPSGGIPASDLASGVIPTVPTNVSAFTNDAGYLTSASVVTIYSGSTAPSSSLGNNGDIYIQTS